jgi:hypothetical protein
MRREDLPLSFACDADWDTMTPAGKKKFCAECKKHVHDLSRMTEEEARALLATPALEGLCIRYVYDAEGKVAFEAPLPASSLLRKAKRFVAGAAALALPMSLNACMGAYAGPPAKAPASAVAPATATAPTIPAATSTTPISSAPTTSTPPLAPAPPAPGASPAPPPPGAPLAN